MSPITRFQGDLQELEYLDYTTMALPYHVRPPHHVLILGAGGGSDLLLALRYQTPRITVLEPNRQIIHLMKNQFGPYSGHIYSRPEITVKISDGRQFLHDTEAAFDLVHLSLLASRSAASGGSHGAMENYLLTTEAFGQVLSCLTEDGVMVISHWLQFPPRSSSRLLTTALEALQNAGFSAEPERHLAFIRGWMTGTILFSKSPFKRGEIENIKLFCKERDFDVVYYAGMKIEEANQYDLLESPYYYRGAKAITGPNRDEFIKDYLYDISPPTDNRPYFFQFFRLGRFVALFDDLKKDSIPFVELGILFILGTLIQATFSSIFLILFPLLFLRVTSHPPIETKALKTHPRDFVTLAAYFAAIGLAFMFIEMVFIPQYALLLSHPVYSVATVLSVILIAAGMGSLSVTGLKVSSRHLAIIPAIVILAWAGIQPFAGAKLFTLALGWSFVERLALALVLLFVISFFLGWPFPLGLRFTSVHYPKLVPWVWCINGCASVIGAVLGKYLSMILGHQAVLLLASGLYLFAMSLYQGYFAKRMEGTRSSGL
jgi:spermidine synthase